MSTDRSLDPQSPFVWPDNRVLQGICQYAHPVAFQAVAANAKAVFGIVSNLDEHGVAWLTTVLSSVSDIKCRLVVAVYPACPTEHSDLEDLHQTQVEFDGRARFRIHLSDAPSSPNALCFLNRDDSEPTLVVGTTTNFGVQSSPAGEPNFAFFPESLLFDEWRKWFELLWHTSAPLNAATAKIPPLVPAIGTPEARDMWLSYKEECDAQDAAFGPLSVVEVDPDTGEVTTADPEGTEVESPTADMGVTPLDPVAGRIAKIFQAGGVVTIDKTSRVPPLDTPIRAEWFGVESLREIGTVTRRVAYRISALQPSTLQEIDKRRTAIRDVLKHLTFPLADGVRWMPYKAQVIFEREMERIEAEGKAILSEATKGGVDAVVDAQRDRITQDANQMYQDFRPAGVLPTNVIDEILIALKARLAKAAGGKLLPQIGLTPVQFALSRESEWVSPWRQACSLLFGLAEFPRRVISNDPFFLRRLRADPEELLLAMDVSSDAIVRDRQDYRTRQRALDEIDAMKVILSSEEDDRTKCAEALRIMGLLVPSNAGTELGLWPQEPHETSGEDALAAQDNPPSQTTKRFIVRVFANSSDLSSIEPSGPLPKLSEADHRKLKRALAEGQQAQEEAKNIQYTPLTPEEPAQQPQPEHLSASDKLRLSTIGGGLIANGANTRELFDKAMTDELGGEIGPFLDELYNYAERYYEHMLKPIIEEHRATTEEMKPKFGELEMKALTFLERKVKECKAPQERKEQLARLRQSWTFKDQETPAEIAIGLQSILMEADQWGDFEDLVAKMSKDSKEERSLEDIVSLVGEMILPNFRSLD